MQKITHPQDNPQNSIGSHQNIVYLFNQGTSPGGSTGAIKRYDASTGQKVIIVTSPKSRIGEAQISADGQWILFTADDAQGFGTTLQLVRMDGQGLQTLYCSMSGNGVGNIQWSPDQKTVVFVDVHGFIGLGGSPSTVDLLDLAHRRRDFLHQRWFL